EVDVVLPVDAPALADLLVDALRDHVARGEVLDRRRVALHEALALGVPEDAALAAGALCDEDAEAVEPRGVELHELHVLERDARAEGDGEAVAGAGVGVRGRLVGAAVAAGGEADGLGVEG